ncbi:MAG: hypothetical protein ACE5KM_04955, partial [Planctomycetaceae bacterium]
MHRQFLSSAFLNTIAVCLAANVAFAQPKPGYLPSATHIFPPGGKRGTTIKVRVGAECIPPETRFTVLGKGVTPRNPAQKSPAFAKSRASERGPALLTERLEPDGEPAPRRKPTTVPVTLPKEWASELVIGKDAPLGTVFWRLSCAQGGTALRPFVVGDLPEFIETESNSTPQTADEVALPVTVNGRIFGERDNDYFRFTAERGAVIVCEVLSQRLMSRLDPIVEVFDAAGRPVSTEMIYVQRDPVIAFRAGRSGPFLLRVSHVSYHGSPAHVYRLNLSTRPFVRSAFPTTGRAGTERDVEFRLMTGTRTPRFVKRKVRFSKQPNPAFRVRPTIGGVATANGVPFTVTAADVRTETEPNDARTSANRLTLPAAIDGRNASATDADWFAFSAEKGRHYSFTCRAPRSGSLAFPTLLLADAQGKTLKLLRSVESDDRVCRLEWRAPVTGSYCLRVRDQRFGAQGGPEFAYRLSVRRAEPDFELLLPSATANVMQGKTAHVTVLVKRRGGFDGPIALTVEGLPNGVTAKAELIRGTPARATVALKATKSAPAADARIRIIGKARAGSRKLFHAARSTNLLDANLATPLQLTVQHRPVFRLYCGEAYQYAHRGSVFQYPMTVERVGGFAGEVTLQVGDRQNRDMDGIEIGTVKVPAQKSEALVPIYLPETMHINVQSQSQLYTQGFALFTDTHGRRQSVLVLSEKRNMLRTLPPVVKMNAVAPAVTGVAGKTVRCELQLERTSNFPGPMTVRLRPAGRR